MSAPNRRLIEIRSHKLNAGEAAALHAAVIGAAMPMLRLWQNAAWMTPDSVEDLRRSNPPPGR